MYFIDRTSAIVKAGYILRFDTWVNLFEVFRGNVREMGHFTYLYIKENNFKIPHN